MNLALSLLPDVGLAVVAITVGVWTLPAAQAAFAGVLAALVTIVAAVDRRLYIIPDTANLGLAAVGLALVLWEAPAGDWAAPLGEAVARGLVAGLLFWSLRAVHRVARGVEGLGLGDVKLAAAGAPWLAWSTLVPVLELAVLAALIAVVIDARARRTGPALDDMVPFGVFLAPALWLGFLAERTGVLDRFSPF
jgi:leader peptidase (prepilin peptidase)/N-methyltransferase